MRGVQGTGHGARADTEIQNLLPRQYRIAMARRFSQQFCIIGIVIGAVVVLAMSFQQSRPREGAGKAIDPAAPVVSHGHRFGYDGAALAD